MVLSITASASTSEDRTVAALESRLLQILNGIVDADVATRDGSFLDLGLGSLIVIQLYAMIEQLAPGVLTLQEVFDHPTVAALAAMIHDRLAPAAIAPVHPQDVEL